MFIEISFGLYHLVILHCLGHAFLRPYQILKSASTIQEFMDFEDAHQNLIANPSTSIMALFVPQAVQHRLFSLAFNLSLNDSFGPSKIVVFLEIIAGKLERYEDKWLNKIMLLRKKPNS